VRRENGEIKGEKMSRIVKCENYWSINWCPEDIKWKGTKEKKQ